MEKQCILLIELALKAIMPETEDLFQALVITRSCSRPPWLEAPDYDNTLLRIPQV